MKIRTLPVVLSLLSVFAFSPQAVVGSELIVAERTPPEFSLESVSDPSRFDFLTLAAYRLGRRADQGFYQDFRPARIAQVSLMLKGDTEAVYERLQDRAQGSLEKSFERAVWDLFTYTAVYHQIDDWVNDRLPRFFVDLWHNSGPADEREISLRDAVSSEEGDDWLETVQRTRRIQPRILLGRHPAFSLSSRVRYHDRVFGVATLGYRFEGVTDHDLQALFSVPIYRKAWFTTGFNYDVFHPEDSRFIARLSLRSRSGMVTSLAYSAQRHEQVVLEWTTPIPWVFKRW